MEPNPAPSYWDPDNENDEINVAMTAVGRLRLSATGRPSPVKPAKPPKCLPRPIGFPSLPSLDASIPSMNLEPGEMAEDGLKFIPLLWLESFSEKYVDLADWKEVTHYFTVSLFKHTVWDLFSMTFPFTTEGPPLFRTERPLLFVTSGQFERYLGEVSVKHGSEIIADHEKWKRRICIDFGRWGTPRPRFLLRRGSYCDLAECGRLAMRFPADDIRYLTPACALMYKDRMNKIYDEVATRTTKNPGAGSTKKRIAKAENARNMFTTSYNILGVRTGSDAWLAEPTRLVAVDIEVYEKYPKVVTEIGVALYDKKDIVNGVIQIQAYHIRIREHYHLINSEYVEGCPGAFNFGESIIVPKHSVPECLSSIIGVENAIFVGHDAGQDKKYLDELGYKRPPSNQAIEWIDTQTLFQYLVPDSNHHSLAHVCNSLGIDGHNYHNAGNDAAYTLKALCVMVEDGRNLSALEIDPFHPAYTVFHPERQGNDSTIPRPTGTSMGKPTGEPASGTEDHKSSDTPISDTKDDEGVDKATRDGKDNKSSDGDWEVMKSPQFESDSSGFSSVGEY